MMFGKRFCGKYISLICAGHSFMQCQILHRAHYTKARLAKMFDTVSPLCDRCQQATANYSHMFWSCSSLTRFWSEIFSTLSKVTGRGVTPNALTALFGVWSFPPTLSPAKKDLIAFTTLLARRLILLKWKSSVPPTYTNWVKEVLYFLKLEKIRLTLIGKDVLFEKTWNPFLSYVNSTRCPF